MFFLYCMIFAIVTMVADNILGTAFTIGEGYYAVSMGYGWIYVLFMIALLIPTISVMVRRLHDVGKSSWWLFISLIPLIGGTQLLILFCNDSNPGENDYVPSPKASTVQEE